jgi:GDP-4-dehydro-6-deoxy-D-mannose reductase
MSKTRVLITGATGFVGRHLMNLLPATEFTVFGTSYPQHPAPAEANLFFLDLRLERDVYDAVKMARPQWVFHLAAVSNVRHSWEKRRETMETNVMGTFYLFEAAKKLAPEARILFVSSSDIYGSPSGREGGIRKPFREGAPFELTSPYALSKVGGELLAGFYTRIEGLDIVIARPFSHTGPGQSPDFVCSDWARQIIQIERGACPSVIRVGNVDVERDYTDVRDTVRAYVLLLKKGKKGEVYNICRGEPVSLRWILETYVSLCSKTVAVEQDQQRLRKVDIPFLGGDSSRLMKETGWSPQIPLERTLRDLLDYWRARP